jgi:hypothetical protein
MPYELALPKRLKRQGWKVKIREKERLEPPHVTVMHGVREWRISLRTGEPLVPPGGSWKEIDEELVGLLESEWQTLQDAWDEMYPTNPISSVEDENDD